MNRVTLDPNRPYLVVDEQEPDGQGGQVDAVTVFLTASECPIGCQMCDLWKNTLTTPTSSGAIPRQIEDAVGNRLRSGWIKLYNSGNFFDPQSIPPRDYPAIADLCHGYSRVIVENHPRFGAQRLKIFRELLEAPLEVAVGLETVQPRWIGRLQKQMTRDDFDRYARWLRSEHVDLRVFVIIGMPGVTVNETIRWTRLSVRHAIASGARHVSLIPARNWPGENPFGPLPLFSNETLCELQSSVIQDTGGRAVVTIDAWDVDRNSEHYEQLNRVNLRQRE